MTNYHDRLQYRKCRASFIVIYFHKGPLFLVYELPGKMEVWTDVCLPCIKNLTSHTQSRAIQIVQ